MPLDNTAKELHKYTLEEVATHNKADDCWIIIDGRVFDMSHFLDEHPGGKKVVLREGGKDASKKFHSLHGPSVMANYEEELLIGVIASKSDSVENKMNRRLMTRQLIESFGGFGDLIPYGDPSWYRGWNSMYYKESHKHLRKVVREHVNTNIAPFVFEWDEKKQIPLSLLKICAEGGFTGASMGPPWLTEFYGTKLPGDLKPEEFDAFHELIIIDETSRCGSGGVLWGLLGGVCIGLPPLIHFGSDYLKNTIVKEVMKGNKTICLAITEPYAGSDVANLRTTATKTIVNGEEVYIVNGEKKWITNGTFADYFTVAVRTGGEGGNGVSMLVISREMKGVKTKQLHCSGVWASGTAYITFEDVVVPTKYLIGKENHGFQYVMYNFNHERWAITAQALRFARVCLEESIKYALKRKTFGKPLIKHQVIRHKLAEMAWRVESSWSFLESITYQLTIMDHKTATYQLSGSLALIKGQASKVFEFCAREAQQIFGGLGYTRGGQGEKVERLAREVRAYAVPAGSEEIMLDLAVKIAEKQSKAMQGMIKRGIDAQM